MKVFVIKDTDEPLYINRENVETKTLKSPPYYVRHADDTYSIFAKCPACKNPIQIIGIYKKINQNVEPYGKHTTTDVKGIANINYDKLMNCPFLSKSDISILQKRIPKNNERVIKFIDFLLSNYDLVIEQLEEETGLEISLANTRLMLSHFVGDQAWNYYNTSIENVPWTITEADSPHRMYMQFVKRKSDLYMALKNINGLVLEDGEKWSQVKTQNGIYVDLYYVWIHRKSVEINGQYQLQTTFKVFRQVDNSNEEVYSKTYICDVNGFMKKVNDETRRKNKKILRIAEEILCMT